MIQIESRLETKVEIQILDNHMQGWSPEHSRPCAFICCSGTSLTLPCAPDRRSLGSVSWTVSAVWTLVGLVNGSPVGGEGAVDTYSVGPRGSSP